MSFVPLPMSVETLPVPLKNVGAALPAINTYPHPVCFHTEATGL